MEACELRVSLPASSAAALVLPGQSFPLAVYRLESTQPLDPTTLSYKTSPRRIAKVGIVQVAHANSTLWRHEFSCKEGEVLTFELACAEWNVATHKGDSCQFEWWQDREAPNPGMLIESLSLSTGQF